MGLRKPRPTSESARITASMAAFTRGNRGPDATGTGAGLAGGVAAAAVQIQDKRQPAPPVMARWHEQTVSALPPSRYELLGRDAWSDREVAGGVGLGSGGRSDEQDADHEGSNHETSYFFTNACQPSMIATGVSGSAETFTRNRWPSALTA